MEFNLKN